MKKKDIVAATPVPPTDAEEIARLATLSPMDCDREIEKAAKHLNVRRETLRKEVEKARDEAKVNNDIAKFALVDPKPWAKPVDGALLLEELRVHFQAYVILPEHSPIALGLWTM